MSDPLNAVLMKLGAVESKIENLVERSDEDRKDAGRHRQNQREQMSELREEVRSTNDQVTRIVPIVDDLHEQAQKKKFKRELARTALRHTGRWAVHIAATFTSVVLYFFGIFDKFGKMIAALLH